MAQIPTIAAMLMAAVPEPSTYAHLALAGVILAFYRFRRIS